MKLIVCLPFVVLPTFLWAQDGGTPLLGTLLGGTEAQGVEGGLGVFAEAMAEAKMVTGGLDVAGAVVPGIGDLALGGSISASDTGASSSTNDNSSSGTN